MKYTISVSVFLAVSIVLMAFIVRWYDNRPPEIVETTQTRPFEQIADGLYTGTEGYVVVEVKVSGGLIESIKIKQNKGGSYSESAENVIDRILQAQSLKVDMITGATATSEVIVGAVKNALDSAN